jgi:hypothetical protein
MASEQQIARLWKITTFYSISELSNSCVNQWWAETWPATTDHTSGRGGGLINLWLYKEQTTGLKKMYLLYISPPELHTLMTSLF